MIYLHVTVAFLLTSIMLKTIQIRYETSADINLWIFGSILTIGLILGSVGIGFDFGYSIYFLAYGNLLSFASLCSMITSYLLEKGRQKVDRIRS
ncbi:hypothetical protein ACFOGI_15265 [Virgibacillus xinjiangensis]|uniref:Uncharacterized protein n=1 Tax=Virgibacillus xinjiangensis TaxID=393090 RepID=A0ABV7CZM0_9BACI